MSGYYTVRKKVDKAFDPNQPRAPKGSPKGGQWVDLDSSSSSTDLAEAAKKVVVFHGTMDEVLESVLEKGLIPNSGTAGGDDFMRVMNPEMAALMLLHQHVMYPGRKASVFVTEKEDVAVRFANYASAVNPGSRGLIFEIEVPRDSSGWAPDEFSDPSMVALRRKGGIPSDWIKRYRLLADEEQKIAVVKSNTLYAVIMLDNKAVKASSDHNSVEFHAELLDNEGAEEVVVAQTVERMKAHGLSQEDLDLAYGKSEK